MKQLLLVGVGGFAGSVLRYVIHLWSHNWIDQIPSGTMIVNVVGSLLIGLLIGYSVKPDQSTYAVLVVGFCGGFTTFSTFAMDGIKLMREELWVPFITYAGVSIIGGFIAVVIGLWIGNKLA
jgi:CrcB protein